MDLTLRIANDANIADLVLSPPSLLTGQDLETALIISIFTHRRANDDDPLLPGESRRGWWADTYNPKRNDKIGSRLWLLRRAKMLDETLVRAREYVIEALRWLIEDSIAQSTDVSTSFIGANTIGIYVTIVKPTGRENFNFEYVWNDI